MMKEVCSSLSLDEANTLAFGVISLTDTYLKPVEVVGSMRRRKPIVGDIDLIGVATASGWSLVKYSLVGMVNAKVKMSGSEILRLLVPFARGYAQIDVYRATEDNYGIVKLVRTGSAKHNVYLAKRAIKMGMHMAYSKGLTKDDEVIAGKTETEVFEALELPYIIPAEREIVNGKPTWLK